MVISNNHFITIGIVAGEISGDILGAGIIQELRKCSSNIDFFGIAGPHMQAAGMNTWYNMEELTTMGVVEIITKLPKILWILYDLIQRFLILKPDIFIGIDLPDFNLILEKYLKNHGIYTIHYVSPSVWAWRKKRIFKIAQATNNLLVLLPFEKMLYDRLNIPCRFVGHALADVIPLNPNKISARYKLGISHQSICLALLPGSRKNEIKRLIHDFIACAELLNRSFPGIEILIPAADIKLITYFQNIYSKIITLRILDKKLSIQAMIAADIALLASGTATLECMLAKCPMVVAYRMHPITFILVKHLIKTPWISLPNILAKKKIIEEFVQNDCTPKNLSQALISLLTNNKKRLVLQNTFQKLHRKIRCNANKQIAFMMLDIINQRQKNTNIAIK